MLSVSAVGAAASPHSIQTVVSQMIRYVVPAVSGPTLALAAPTVMLDGCPDAGTPTRPMFAARDEEKLLIPALSKKGVATRAKQAHK
jgi:hypothetical protein